MDTGIIAPFAGKTSQLPLGWVLCDGKEYDHTNPTYAPLFGVIGTIWGGDANPNFKVPDLRGLFLRGVDGGARRDPEADSRTPAGTDKSNEVGSLQDEQFKSHSHTIHGKHLQADGGSGFDGTGLDSNSTNQGAPWTKDVAPDTSGGTETRPKNAYVNYIIKL